MTPDDALADLFDRLAANGGRDVYLIAQEYDELPAAVVAALESERIVVPARPAATVVCRGCERQCAMPVFVLTGPEEEQRAFVVCDKRDDVNRVPVPLGDLEQRRLTGRTIVEWIARTLGMNRSVDDYGAAGRWEIGVLRGDRHASHLALIAEPELMVTVAGVSVPLIELVRFKKSNLVLDSGRLKHCVDHPVGGAGGAESAEQRRERLHSLVEAEKAKGNRTFLKTVADAENISRSRLKQLLEKAGGARADDDAEQRRPSNPSSRPRRHPKKTRS